MTELATKTITADSRMGIQRVKSEIMAAKHGTISGEIQPEVRRRLVIANLVRYLQTRRNIHGVEKFSNRIQARVTREATTTEDASSRMSSCRAVCQASTRTTMSMAQGRKTSG